jgi:hypothetical protein
MTNQTAAGTHPGLATFLPIALQLLEGALPLIAGISPQVATAVKVVTVAAPFIAKEYQDLKPVVQRIIATLKSDSAATDDQISELEAAEAVLDQDFDSAAAAAEAEDGK